MNSALARLLTYLLLFCCCDLVIFVATLMIGSYQLSWLELAHKWWANEPIADWMMTIINLRMHRSLLAFACGGLLATAGLLMQALLQNPLADPYILGLSGGAGVGALVAISLGFPLFWVNGLAFCGALLVTLIVLWIAEGTTSWQPLRLLLTGVVVSSGCGALITLILVLSTESSLSGMLFWLIGDLGQSPEPWGALLILCLSGLAVYPFARDLNLLARGTAFAQSLGVAVTPLRLLIYAIASLATATAVSYAGSIGFVGLVIPHLLRLKFGSDHRLLIPLSLLSGGGLLMLADTAARTVAAPLQLPVGVFTAFLGVPLFLWLIHKQRFKVG